MVEDAPPRSEIEVPTRGAGVGHTQLRQERARCRLCLLTQGLRPGWRAFSALYGRRIWVAESQLVQNSSIFGLKKDHFQIWRFLELAGCSTAKRPRTAKRGEPTSAMLLLPLLAVLPGISTNAVLPPPPPPPPSRLRFPGGTASNGERNVP